MKILLDFLLIFGGYELIPLDFCGFHIDLRTCLLLREKTKHRRFIVKVRVESIR